MMTRQHFQHAAIIVKAIRDGYWTDDFPSWADDSRNVSIMDLNSDYYTRAVQTAEAFIKLFREFNPRFNQAKFLKACGLVGLDKL